MAHSGYQSTRWKTGAIYHSAASQGPSWHCLAPSQDSAQDPPRPVSREQPDHKPSTGSTPQTASIVRSPRGRTQQDNLNSARPHTHPALSTGRTSTDCQIKNMTPLQVNKLATFHVTDENACHTQPPCRHTLPVTHSIIRLMASNSYAIANGISVRLFRRHNMCTCTHQGVLHTHTHYMH